MLKIEELNIGDKLYCIKNFIGINHIPNEERKIFLNGRLVKNLSKIEKSQYNKIPSTKIIEYKILVNGNTYEILSKISNEISVSTEVENILFKEKIESICNFNQNELFLNEHFIPFTESRKQKLQLLSDNNFNSFLKKIKK